jgi:PhnB protein
MAALNPYLNFNGNTEEAFDFYRSVFGGSFAALMRYKDTPEAAKVPAGEQEKIMHIALPVSQNILMGTDTLASMGHQVQPGTNMSISVSAASNEEAVTVFNALAEGGQVAVAFQEMFWGDNFGMLTDRFGVQWMVSYTTPRSQQ